MKTTIRAFYFDLKNPADRAAWEKLRASLKDGPREMESHGGASYWFNTLPAEGAEIELETKHIFDNQWNTTADSPVLPNHRVFDFAFDYKPDNNPNIRRGHYLVQTEEMREIRRNIHKCGYCGAHERAAKGYVFCPHCIDSEYLKESNLHLTRMRPAGEDFGTKREPLSDAERAYLLPLYRDAQLHGSTERGKKRIVKARADLHADYEKAIREAKTKRDGFLWLMDRGIKTDNCIYYSHTDRFSFGWRQPVDEALKSALLDIMSEFPFRYEIKCADGRTLNNE